MKKRILFLTVGILALLILLCSCAGRDLTSGTASVTVDKKGRELTITVMPDERLAGSYKGSTLYLFALAPGNDGSYLVDPVANKKSGSTVKYKLPVTENGISRLYYSFTAAYFDETVNQFIPAVNSPVYLSNPDVLAGNTDEFVSQKSIKGINTVYDTETVSLGTEHAVIDIYIEDYLLPTGSNEAFSYIFGGKSFYLDKKAVETLDGRVQYLTNNNVGVYFRFKLGTAVLPEGLSCLACPGAAAGAAEYPINMKNAFCAEYMAGFLDFMAERYTREDKQYGLCGSFIAGNSLNTPGIGSGTLGYDDSLLSSAMLVRTMYTALSSHYKNGRVYVSVDNLWKISGAGAADKSGYQFLNDFAALARAQGDYPWGISASIKASSTDPDRIWYDNSGDGVYLTPSNLASMTGTEFLSASGLLWDGETRNVILGGFSVVANDSTGDNQAASYAYAYYNAIADKNIDAIIYSYQADSATVKAGLRTTDAQGNPAGIRPIYSVYRYIDTDADINTTVAATINESSWTTLYSSYSSVAQVKLSRLGLAVAGVDAATYNTSVLYNFGSGLGETFSVQGENSYSGLVRNGTTSSVQAVLTRDNAADISYIYRLGIQKKELRRDRLLITLCPGALPGKTAASSYEVTLSLVQDNAKNSEVLYESTVGGLAPGETVTVEFDIKPFKDAPGKGGIELRLSASGSDGSGCTLRVDSLLTGKAQKNTWLIVILIVLASAAVIAVIVLFIIWFRKNYTLNIGKSNKPAAKNNTVRRPPTTKNSAPRINESVTKHDDIDKT